MVVDYIHVLDLQLHNHIDLHSSSFVYENAVSITHCVERTLMFIGRPIFLLIQSMLALHTLLFINLKFYIWYILFTPVISKCILQKVAFIYVSESDGCVEGKCDSCKTKIHGETGVT